jgi:bifunctional UDP-N-acetylglucosamine pyrophosphorylase/glucosamine-1-phosphate N-acetyltransferase
MNLYISDLSAFPFAIENIDALRYWQLLSRIKEILKQDTILSEIPAGVSVKGPVYIGRNVELSPGAYIRPYSVICDNCVIGHGSEIKAAVLFPGAKVGSLCFVGDSVLGRGARVGSGSITANRRFDQGNVIVHGAEKADNNDSGRDYLGALLGDYARLGANCTTLPGTQIGSYTWVYPATKVSGLIPGGKHVYIQNELVMRDGETVKLK